MTERDPRIRAAMVELGSAAREAPAWEQITAASAARQAPQAAAAHRGLVGRLWRRKAGASVPVVRVGGGDMEETSRAATGRRGPLIAVAALVAALLIALPLWFVFRGEESPPVVTEPTVVTTTILSSTTTIPAGTTTTAAGESAATTTVPAVVVDLGSPDRLSDFQAKPLPPAATCPAGSTPDVPGGDTWWPAGGWIVYGRAAFDWDSGRLVTGIWDRIWLFDPCRNVWEGRAGPASEVWGPLVYDADSDLVLAFAGDGVWAYDADADAWTRRGGTPRNYWGTPLTAYQRGLQVVYHDPSGLVVGVGGRSSERTMWAYDVESDTWYDLGPANLGRGLLGYDPVGDRFYAYVAGDGGAQTWRYEPGQGWTQLAIPTPDFDLDPDPDDDADPAPMAFDRSAGRFVIVDQGVVAALDPSLPEWEIIFDQSEGPGPLDRSYQTAVYDPLNGRLVVLGGRYGEDEWANDVWAFDTSSREWRELLPIVAWAGIVPVPSVPEDPAWGQFTAVSASEVWAADGADIGHLDDGVWTSYRLADYGAVADLAVAPDGTVWVATDLGVFSFDGEEWTRRFDRPAVGIGVAPDGAVWIAPLREWWLVRWDGTTFVGLPADVPGEHHEPSGVWSRPLAVLGDGQVWVAEQQGWFETVLLRYDGATLEEVPVPYDFTTTSPGIDGMEAAPNADLWIWGPAQSDASGPLLARFDGETWRRYDTGGFYVWDIAVGSEGVVWLSGGDGLVSFDGTDWTYHIGGQGIRAVDVAPDGTVWYLDERGGLHTLD